MKNDVVQDKPRNSRRIQRRAQGNRMVHRIIVSQTSSAGAQSPSYIADFDLVVEISGIDFPIDFPGRIVFASARIDMFPTSQQAPLPYSLGNSGIPAKSFISPQYSGIRPSARNLTGKNKHQGLKHGVRGVPAMIAYADNPSGFFAPYRVRKSYIGIEGGFYFGAAEWRERGRQYGATDSLQC
jgi:hypothetical protein